MSKEQLAEYSSAVNNFFEVLNSFSTSDLSKSPSANDWSAAFVVHHMADSESYFLTRYYNTLTENRPSIHPFDEDLFPASLKYAERDPQKSIGFIKASSAILVDVLQSVSAESWNRISIHPEAGELKVSDILGKAISHTNAHTGQLKEIKDAL